LTSIPKDEVLDVMIGLVEDTKEVWTTATNSLEKFAHPQTTKRLIAELDQAATDWAAVEDEPKKPAKKGVTRGKAKTPRKPARSEAQKQRDRLQERIKRFITALGRRPDGEQGVDSLIAVSTHPVAGVRDLAVQTLGAAVGGKSPKTVPALT